MLIRDRASVLGIFLIPEQDRELRIGSLIREATGVISFVLDDAYLRLGPTRPLVSLAWRGASEAETVARLTARGDKIMHGGLLPPFFQNLLPEGALRELVIKELGSGPFDHFDLLARLGGDLPGAIVARMESGPMDNVSRAPVAPLQPSEQKVRFSLAGIQLKFSMKQDRGAITAPGVGVTGGVILKTPSPHYKFLPEVEHTALRLAAAVGVRTVEAWLATPDQIEGLPPYFLSAGDHSLVVRRYDRAAGGVRIQTEDFAQIFGAIGDAKYTTGNDPTIMNAVQRFATDSRGELLEAFRRIVVNILLGNGDAHLKNWSFLYEETGKIRLTPAYDIVPTFLYGDGAMALSFGGTRDPTKIGRHRIERAAGLLKVDPRILVSEARRTMEAAFESWPAILREAPLPQPMRTNILQRLPTLQLVQEVRPTLPRGIAPKRT